jgi:hypothetical protein
MKRLPLQTTENRPRIRLDFCCKGRIVMCVGRLTCSPVGASLGIVPGLKSTQASPP